MTQHHPRHLTLTRISFCWLMRHNRHRLCPPPSPPPPSTAATVAAALAAQTITATIASTMVVTIAIAATAAAPDRCVPLLKGSSPPLAAGWWVLDE